MARKPKDVYSRITEKKAQIKEAEDRLQTLNEELKNLNKERDDLEMKQMFEAARERNLDVRAVINIMSKMQK